MAKRNSIVAIVALIAISAFLTISNTVHAAGSQDGRDELDPVPVAYASDISPRSSYSGDGHVRYDNELISQDTSPLTLADLPDEILARYIDPDSKFRLMQTASHFRNAMYRVHPEFHKDDPIRPALQRDCGTALAKQILHQTYGLNDYATKTIDIVIENRYRELFLDWRREPGTCARALRKHCERKTLSTKQPLRFVYDAQSDEELTNILAVMDTLNACEVRLTLSLGSTSNRHTRLSADFATALSSAIANSRALHQLNLHGFGEPSIMAALADGLRRNRSLRNLLLWDDYADKRGIGMIGEALAANALLPLEELVIFGQAIDDHRVAAAIVEGISMQRNLQSISLFNLYLDDESMRELADALHGHDALTNIQLSHCARSCYSITPLLRRIAHNELPSLKRLLLQGAIADGEACALELAAVLKPKGQSDWSGCTAWNVEKLERSLVASKRCGRA